MMKFNTMPCSSAGMIGSGFIASMLPQGPGARRLSRGEGRRRKRVNEETGRGRVRTIWKWREWQRVRVMRHLNGRSEGVKGTNIMIREMGRGKARGREARITKAKVP